MLVITRREGEEVYIGDPANPSGIVRVVSVKGDRVRLAFDFPRKVDVHRREVADQIIAQKPQILRAPHASGPKEGPKDYACYGGRTLGATYC